MAPIGTTDGMIIEVGFVYIDQIIHVPFLGAMHSVLMLFGG